MLNYILGTDEHDQALLADNAVSSFYDKLNSPYGRSLSKKQLVENMVSFPNFMAL